MHIQPDILSRLFIIPCRRNMSTKYVDETCRRNMSTKKLSTKLCRQNELDQIRCRRSVCRQNVCRQSFVDKVSVDKTHCRQMICNSNVSIHEILFSYDNLDNSFYISIASNRIHRIQSIELILIEMMSH